MRNEASIKRALLFLLAKQALLQINIRLSEKKTVDELSCVKMLRLRQLT